MKFTTTFLLLLSFICVNAQGIKFFKGKFEDVKKEAQKENKYIFIDAYTTWCGPCKMMTKSIFPQKEVGDFFNANFVSYKMDMEKGEGIEFKKKYGIRAFPTLIFIDSLGKLVHQIVGSTDANSLIKRGKDALNPDIRIGEIIEQYKKGKRETHFIQKYLKSAVSAFINVKEASDWYFYTQTDKDLMNKDNIELITMLIEDVNHRCFKFLLNNQSKCQSLTDRSLDEYIDYTFMRYLYNAKFKGEYETAKKTIVNSGYKNTNRLLAKIELNELRRAERKDWILITQKVNEYFNKYDSTDYKFRNSLAWSYYENNDIQDKKLLKSALKWAKESVQIKEQYMNMDTYAALLYKLQMKKEALKAATRAIELAKESGDDATETEELLKKIHQL